MKKINCLKCVIVLMVLCILFSACQATPMQPETTAPAQAESSQPTTQPTQQTEPQTEALSLVALLVDSGSDSTIATSQAAEYELWPSEKLNAFQDSAAPQTKTVVFDGISYTGTYQKSLVSPPDTYQADYYEFEKGHFAVNATNGKVVDFLLHIIEEGDKTLAECQEIACNFASQFADISDFSIEVRESSVTNAFIFTRSNGNVNTAERIIVGVSPAGRIKSFSSTMLGVFDELNSVSSANMENSITLLCSEQAETILDTKLQSLYANVDKTDATVSYEIEDQWLLPLPDGTLGKLYTVNVSLSRRTDEGISLSGSLLQILVKCEPSSNNEVA